MAIPAVSVYLKIRVRDPETGETKPMRVSAVWSKNHSLKPFVGLVNGKEEHHPEGTYLLRYGGKWEYVGKAIDLVLNMKREREDDLGKPKAVQTIAENGPRILEALNEYCAIKSQTNYETGQRALARKTIDGYRGTVEAFRRITGKTFMREITGEDLLNYFATLRRQANLDPDAPEYDEKLREKNNTVSNNFDVVCAFFNYHNINLKSLLRRDQIPVYVDRDPEAYTADEMERMWAVAKSEERIRLQFFVASGFRRGEVANLRWNDLDLETGLAFVQPKNGWRSKTRKQRSVTLPDFLVEALRRRLAKLSAYDGAGLVFPSKYGKVTYNQMLCMLKSVAKRAGITGRIDLHKFRSTHASLLQDGEVALEVIQARLGHSSPDMTRHYLRAMQQHTPKARRQANEVFGKLA